MSGKKRTTFAKLARESKLRERRQEKQARKDARKEAGGLHAMPAAEDHEGPQAGGLEETEAVQAGAEAVQAGAAVNQDR